MDIVSILGVAFAVGILVGLTGIGGGALMTPALIFLGISPTTAVASDLVASAFNKSAGAITHWRHGSPNKKLAMWLVIGSVPSAFAGGFIVNAMGTTSQQDMFTKVAIGVALLFAAITYTLRIVVTNYKDPEHWRKESHHIDIRPVPTLVVGIVGGLLVGLTSVGAGSIIMVALLLLYPTMKAASLVGTDLVQAVPLVLAAALSHVITTGADWSIILPLIIGSVPGTMIGARLASKVHQRIIRRSIVIILTLTGLHLLGVPDQLNLLLGLIAVLFGRVLLTYPIDVTRKLTGKKSQQADEEF